MLVATLALAVEPSSRSLLMWCLVFAWGARLASHIWRRNALRGPDRRYDELSSQWPKRGFWTRAYLSVFIVQALLIFIISLPVTLAASHNARSLEVFDVAITALWLVGFVFEAVSDRQLGRFVANPSNRGRLMSQGLWQYSRHPNYFGELLQWWALSFLALGSSWGWVGLAGPAVLSYLILCVSGVPPIERRHSQRPGYADYKRRTSLIIPLPPKP